MHVSLLLALSVLFAQVATRIPENQLPLAPVDRQIDFLGSESNIHSPTDAERYIEAILAKYKIDGASVPGLKPLEHRLSVAEYAAVADPLKRISEQRLADTFNQLMDEWGEAQWTRMTVADFHRFHRIKAATLIPYSVSRDADRNVADTCRPVEAIYLLFLLSIDRGLQSGPKPPALPENFAKGPMFVKTEGSKLTPGGLTADVNRNSEQYVMARDAWLQSHPDPMPEIERLFAALRIE